MGRTAVERLAVFAVLAASLTARADSPSSYVSRREFEIPFTLTPGRPLSEVILHVSRDGKTYSAHMTVEATKRHFDYTAPEDGTYYFVVQTKDTFGQLDPPALTGPVTPSLRVAVDTVRPEIKLRAVEPPKGSAAVEWEVADPHLDPRTLRLEYRRSDGGEWVRLNPTQLDRAHFNWNPAATGLIDVRLTVADLAGHVSSQVVQLRPVPGKDPGPRAVLPGTPKVIHVRTKAFKLNYKIDGVGPSNVKHVELWLTRDTRGWLKHSVIEQINAPMPIQVVAAGRYGFTLRPVSGVGRAADPPALGQMPQIWVEVDETPPEVQIADVKVGEGPDAGYVMVSYRAADKWLRESPITVYHGQTKDGPWEPMEGSLKNTGLAKLATKDKGFQFYLKVEAIDEAGNKGAAVWPDTVKVDLSRPEVKEITVVGVEESRPAVTPVGGPPEGLPGVIPPPP
ncbi:MAG: hypothetical protein ACRC33_26685 [Gemmataceae bacterium]